MAPAKKAAAKKAPAKKKSAKPSMPKGKWFHAYRWASVKNQVRILTDAQGYDSHEAALKGPLPRMDEGMVSFVVYIAD